MYNKYIQETTSLQIDENHFITYYYSNAYGDAVTTFTLYEGDICTPEYAKEIMHCLNGEKRYTPQEVFDYGKELIECRNGLIGE